VNRDSLFFHAGEFMGGLVSLSNNSVELRSCLIPAIGAAGAAPINFSSARFGRPMFINTEKTG
jgi:hypothetical protein